jgi:hypothetical protein
MIMAASLTLGAGRATTSTGRNTANHRLPKIEVAGEGVKAAKDAAGQQIPVQLNLPGNAEQEKQPLLVAPHCSTCVQPPLSTWQQFQLFLSVMFSA